MSIGTFSGDFNLSFLQATRIQDTNDCANHPFQATIINTY
ncbi:hypothetical protein GPUN_2478 [Glaciecola punicea ACAM 611]|uniref:Uncharacterized protein n=1 Tax=Glaciecola punicea ACAM 611 TaxID=1121923 RepID=H5TE66_9ALTE|nr:hypothetical protein GPUN_2478 [Glaciecola punicea ACAM 611]